MNWEAVHGLVDVLSRVYVVAALVALGVVSLRAARNDGVLFFRLTVTWFCLALPFVFNAVGILDELVDFCPALHLRDAMREWLWILHLMVGTAAWAFWVALNQLHPKSKKHGG